MPAGKLTHMRLMIVPLVQTSGCLPSLSSTAAWVLDPAGPLIRSAGPGGCDLGRLPDAQPTRVDCGVVSGLRGGFVGSASAVVEAGR